MAGPTNPEDNPSPGDKQGLSGATNSPQRTGAGTGHASTRSGQAQATAAWSLVVWGAVVVGASGTLAIMEVPLWWLILILGAVVPFVFVAQQNRGPGLREAGAVHAPADKERELLGALRKRGGPTTPVMVALETSLTVEEATGMLEKLARKGHLRVHSDEGVLAYELPATPEGAFVDGPLEREFANEESSPVSPEPLAEPLSEREQEVLRLLASGLTNREIANDLFIALGTVKNHTNGIYRKLGVHNRAGALRRARELALLD